MKTTYKNASSNGRYRITAKQSATVELITTTHISVPVAFYEKIRLIIAENLPCLRSFDYLVPEDLLGLGFWCDLSDAEKRMAKASMAHLSQSNVLPIQARDAEIEHPHFYVLS